MNIISVSSEIVPWSKTGGLGDVCGALPKAFVEKGHQVLTIAPRYKEYPDAWDTGTRYEIDGHVIGIFHCKQDGVDHIFVDHPALCRGEIYGTDEGSYQDNWFRFSLLARSAVMIALHYDWGDKDEQTSFLVHDWHAALVPAYLRMTQKWGLLADVKVALVIHNLAHQGEFPHSLFPKLGLHSSFFSDLDMDGRLNWLKAGIMLSDAVCTVSPSYAKEICGPDLGMGLDGILRWKGSSLYGILNGIDQEIYNPETDTSIAATFSSSDLSGKAECKRALQEELGLEQNSDIPLFGFVSRLDAQKGVELVQEVLPWLVNQGAQVALLGTGATKYENFLRQANSHPRVAGLATFSSSLAKKITSASDFLLMPSRFEPCGLSQQHALRYGTIPIVHATGGLRDTVKSFNPWKKEGNGWAFAPFSVSAFQQALYYALMTYYNGQDDFKEMQVRAMNEDRSWDKAASLYLQVLS